LETEKEGMTMAVQPVVQSTGAPAPRDPFARGMDKARIALYVGPALFGILLLSIVPIIYTIYMSFTNRNGPFRLREGRYEIVGFDNYIRLLGSFDADFYLVVLRTFLFTVVCVALFLVVGLALALILNNPAVRFKALWRTLLIVPWAVPTYVTALVWKFFYNQEFGTINNSLRLLGFDGNIQWLNDPILAFIAVVVVNLWMSYPFFMFIILGALQSIPADIYEAAEVDGSGRWRTLTRITLPLLRPAIMPAIVLSAITTFQIFNTVWLITEGGPVTAVGQPGATEFVMIYVYKQAFRLNLVALSSAFGMLIFIMLFVLVLLNLRITRITRSAYE
jgi:arabinogalactan oligomer/maltooligosaccharide transport system permease protein